MKIEEICDLADEAQMMSEVLEMYRKEIGPQPVGSRCYTLCYHLELAKAQLDLVVVAARKQGM